MALWKLSCSMYIISHMKVLSVMFGITSDNNMITSNQCALQKLSCELNILLNVRNDA
jgi:hypothetical protein